MVKQMMISAIHIASVVQPRGGDIDNDTVVEYTASAKNGAVFPPLVAFNITDRKFPGPILVAGFHRIAAYKRAGIDSAEVDLRTGTFSEAWLAGYQSNLSNGLRYTNLQKRNAVETALKMWRTDSANSIADRLAVSHPFVLKIRDELIRIKEIDAPEKVVGKDGRESKTNQNRGVTVTPQLDTKREETTTTSTRQTETGKHIEPVDEDSGDEDDAEDEQQIEDHVESELNDQISVICREIESTQRMVNDLSENFPAHSQRIKSASGSLKAALDLLWELRE